MMMVKKRRRNRARNRVKSLVRSLLKMMKQKRRKKRKRLMVMQKNQYIQSQESVKRSSLPKKKKLGKLSLSLTQAQLSQSIKMDLVRRLLRRKQRRRPMKKRRKRRKRRRKKRKLLTRPLFKLISMK
jgi:hypothetical protein